MNECADKCLIAPGLFMWTYIHPNINASIQALDDKGACPMSWIFAGLDMVAGAKLADPNQVSG